MENRHKYQIKVPFIEPLESSSKTTASVNYSKALGNSGSWIGCGYIDREGKTKKHINVTFPYFSLVLVIEGKGTYVDSQDQLHHLKKGSVFLRKPEYKHPSHCESQPSWKEYYLDCDLNLYKHLSSFLLPDNKKVVYQTSCPLEIIDNFTSFMEFIKKASEVDMPSVYIKFIELLNSIFNKTPAFHAQYENESINQVKLDLDKFLNQRIDLKSYCESNLLNYEVFRKEFKEQTGLSLMNYMVRRRLDKACTLLRTTNLRVLEISNELGYSSQYEFSKQFKRYFHLSPKQYRVGNE